MLVIRVFMVRGAIGWGCGGLRLAYGCGLRLLAGGCGGAIVARWLSVVVAGCGG